ncbi:MAG: hypothetical protein AB199_02245 [Parcubacteria bacterium C7867-004]|nr:MAG: hypothetical protein AB199_02245 [Parcubacteria bacterium C7867-004]
MRRILSSLLLAFLCFVSIVPAIALAQTGGQPSGTAPTGGQPSGTPPPSNAGSGLVNPLNNIDSLPDFLNAILNAVVDIGSIILVLALVYTGFLFVAAQGNQEKLSSARNALIWTVVGGLVLLGAKAIGLVIEATVKTL